MLDDISRVIALFDDDFLFLNRAWFLDVILDDLHNTRHEGAMFKIWLKSVEFKCIKNSLKD